MRKQTNVQIMLMFTVLLIHSLTIIIFVLKVYRMTIVDGLITN